MSKRERRRTLRVLAVAVVVMAAVGVFLLVGPPRLLAKSDTPDFCVRCHVMESQYEAWAHSGAHRTRKCVDCHLPNENFAVHYVWKSIDGLKDVAVFYSGRVPERIELTSHGAEVLQRNCIRCHETMVSMIGTDRECWRCHRRISHLRSGVVATL